jgi:hypothetical protein
MNLFRSRTARHSRVSTTIVCAAGMLLLAAAAASAATRFRDSSLFGTYAAVGTGDDHVSASVGTATYDGAGNVTRRLLVNAPDGNGGRRLLTFESEGTYEVRPDGTGVVLLTTRIDGGATTEVTFDFVIQESAPNGKGGQRRATKLYGVQREPGTTVTLVTSSETLIAP